MPKRNNTSVDRGLEKVLTPSEESEFRRQESEGVAIGLFDPTGSGGVLQALIDMAAADNRWPPHAPSLETVSPLTARAGARGDRRAHFSTRPDSRRGRDGARTRSGRLPRLVGRSR